MALLPECYSNWTFCHPFPLLILIQVLAYNFFWVNISDFFLYIWTQHKILRFLIIRHKFLVKNFVVPFLTYFGTLKLNAPNMYDSKKKKYLLQMRLRFKLPSVCASAFFIFSKKVQNHCTQLEFFHVYHIFCHDILNYMIDHV